MEVTVKVRALATSDGSIPDREGARLGLDTVREPGPPAREPARSQRRVAIVDAFSTGHRLAPALARYGVRCVHVKSLPEIIAYYLPTYRRGDFDHEIVHHGDLAATAAALAPLGVEHVVPGCESGVTLADALGEAIGVPSNGTSLSHTRRNKLRLAERLRACGLAATPTYAVATAEEAASAARAIGAWPVVVKPVDSSAADGLHFCDDEAAVRAAAAGLLGRVNFMRLLNATVLVQEMLVGQQYIVQAVSREGRHFVSEIWRDDRRRVPGAGVVNDREILLPAEGEVQRTLSAYAGACLDACGVRLGPSFIEVRMTARGPIVIDLAARMMGTQDDEALVRAVGQSQVTLTAACYADPAEFDALTARPYQVREQIAVVSLINRSAGRLRSDSWRERLGALPTFHSVIHGPAVGAVLQPTVDESTNYGIVYLIADRLEHLDRDYRAIRALEASGGLFDLEPPGPC
jgi:biotin carboxylase